MRLRTCVIRPDLQGGRHRGPSRALRSGQGGRPHSRPAQGVRRRALDIRLLSDHRDDLVNARTEDQQRLRWHLHDMWPELEIPNRARDPGKSLGTVSRPLGRADQTTRVRMARELVRQIAARTTRIRKLEAELAALGAAYDPQLLAERGCGALTAAKLIGAIAGAELFATDAKLARTS